MLELDHVLVCLNVTTNILTFLLPTGPKNDLCSCIRKPFIESFNQHVNSSKASDQNIITARNSSSGKVIFSEARVGHSAHLGGGASASGSLGCGRTHAHIQRFP